MAPQSADVYAQQAHHGCQHEHFNRTRRFTATASTDILRATVTPLYVYRQYVYSKRHSRRFTTSNTIAVLHRDATTRRWEKSFNFFSTFRRIARTASSLSFGQLPLKRRRSVRCIQVTGNRLCIRRVYKFDSDALGLVDCVLLRESRSHLLRVCAVLTYPRCKTRIRSHVAHRKRIQPQADLIRALGTKY